MRQNQFPVPASHGLQFVGVVIKIISFVRSGNWKLILPHKYSSIIDQPRAKDGVRGSYKTSAAGLELYDLEKDAGETTDVAAKFPEVVKRLEALAEKAREDMGDSLTNRIGKGTRTPGRLPE